MRKSLPSSLPKIGVVIDLVEKISPLAAAQATPHWKPMRTQGNRAPPPRVPTTPSPSISWRHCVVQCAPPPSNDFKIPPLSRPPIVAASPSSREGTVSEVCEKVRQFIFFVESAVCGQGRLIYSEDNFCGKSKGICLKPVRPRRLGPPAMNFPTVAGSSSRTTTTVSVVKSLLVESNCL